MREYKFRGRRIDNGEWVYGSLINNLFFESTDKSPIQYIVDPTQYEEYDSFEDVEYLAIEVDYATVGQFTGLKDKNDKEIYEGDILHDYHGTRHVIQYFQPDTRFISIYADEYASGNWDDGNESIGLIWVDCEVIGNIYEAPKLLKGDENNA